MTLSEKGGKEPPGAFPRTDPVEGTVMKDAHNTAVMDNAQLEYPSHPLETLTCCNGT